MQNLLTKRVCTVILLVTLAAAQANAQGPIWYVAGDWKLDQGSYVFPMKLGQIAPSQPTFNGYAIMTQDQQVRAGLSNPYGNLGGTIKGDHIAFDIVWTKRNGQQSIGHYEGTLIKGAIIDGKCWDKQHPDKTASWSATGPAHH